MSTRPRVFHRATVGHLVRLLLRRNGTTFHHTTQVFGVGLFTIWGGATQVLFMGSRGTFRGHKFAHTIFARGNVRHTNTRTGQHQVRHSRTKGNFHCVFRFGGRTTIFRGGSPLARGYQDFCLCYFRGTTIGRGGHLWGARFAPLWVTPLGCFFGAVFVLPVGGRHV